MAIDDVFDEIRNPLVKIERVDVDKINVSAINGIFSNLILRIYPESRMAEFIDIEDKWDDLNPALKSKYPEIPELKKIVDFMNEENYGIIW